MPNFPRGYQMWADYNDESPEDLANRLRAEHIDVHDLAREQIAARLDKIADLLDTIATNIKENQNV